MHETNIPTFSNVHIPDMQYLGLSTTLKVRLLDKKRWNKVRFCFICPSMTCSRLVLKQNLNFLCDIFCFQKLKTNIFLLVDLKFQF